MKKITKIYVGVDISKNNLDICLLPGKKSFRIQNDIRGIEVLIKELSKHTIERIVCESSGGYENLLIQTLVEANYQFWRVDPKRISAFIASEGVKAKTDPIDAFMIALFAQQKELPEYARIKKPKLDAEKLRAIVDRRDALTRTAAEEKTRLKHPYLYICRQEIKEHITFLKKQIKLLEKEIKLILKNDADWTQKLEIITSIPGVGITTGASLIAYLPELGTLGNKQAAALVGLAPYANQSGNKIKKFKIAAGRASPRKALYMAALSATQFNHDIKIFYQRLVNAGKLKKIALVAVMRKLLILTNVLIGKNESWKQKNALFT